MDATRRALIAAAALAALAPRAPRAARAAEPAGDAGVLTTILEAELALAYVSASAVASGLLGEELAEAAGTLAEHERAHAAAIATQLEALGGRRPDPPQTPEEADAMLAGLGIEARLGAVSDGDGFLRVALAAERVAVALYHRAIARLEDVRLIQTAASIIGAEGQHLVVLRDAIGSDPVPSAVEIGQS